MKNKKTKSQLRKILDKIFSEYIRRRSANRDGDVKCYTCPKTGHYKDFHCGHFIPRQYLATRYHEANCQVQCMACNLYYNGQPGAFASRLEREYGKGTVEMLEKLRQKIVPDFAYQYWIDIYKEKIETLDK